MQRSKKVFDQIVISGNVFCFKCSIDEDEYAL